MSTQGVLERGKNGNHLSARYKGNGMNNRDFSGRMNGTCDFPRSQRLRLCFQRRGCRFNPSWGYKIPIFWSNQSFFLKSKQTRKQRQKREGEWDPQLLHPESNYNMKHKVFIRISPFLLFFFFFFFRCVWLLWKIVMNNAFQTSTVVVTGQ